MEHVLSKAILIAKVCELMSAKYGISLAQARDRLYRSSFIDLIDDDETGFYGESPLYVFSAYEEQSNQ